jgi:hypothetical protein
VCDIERTSADVHRMLKSSFRVQPKSRLHSVDLMEHTILRKRQTMKGLASTRHHSMLSWMFSADERDKAAEVEVLDHRALLSSSR